MTDDLIDGKGNTEKVQEQAGKDDPANSLSIDNGLWKYKLKMSEWRQREKSRIEFSIWEF